MSTALLVIDLQRGAFDGVRWHAISEPERLLGNALALLDAARSTATPVIFVRHCDKTPGELFEEGSVQAELHESLAPRPGETVLKKYASSAFENTDLESTLRTLAAQELVLCGLQSEFCVSNTAKAALGLGFQVTIASDGHGTWASQDEPARAISDRANTELQSLGATVQPTADVLRRLQ
jgi:nicotinamidase-related amidase